MLSGPAAETPYFDRVAPPISVSGVASGGSYQSTVCPSFSSAAKDLERLSATLDGGSWSSGIPVGNGRHTLVVTACDTSGNTAQCTVRFTIGWFATQTTLSGPATAPGYGKGATLKARAMQGAVAVSGRSVRFERLSGSAWIAVGTATTTSNGYATMVTAGLAKNTQFRARLLAALPYLGSSATASVKPQAFLGPTTATRTGARTYRLSGAIGPNHYSSRAAVMSIWKYVNGSPSYLGKMYVAAAGPTYSLNYRFPQVGKWRIQITHLDDVDNGSASTRYTDVWAR